MRAHLDAIGNVCGRYEGERPGLPCLMLGSHYDTVRDAGKWDGPLGMITAISCVADLHRRGRRLPFAIEVDRFRRRGGRPVRVDLARQPRGGGHLRRERSRRERQRRHFDARGDDRIRARSRSYRRGREGSERIARLCRTPYRAGTGAGNRNICRLASSPPSPVRRGWRRAWSAWPAMPAPCRWRCATMRSPAPPSALSRSRSFAAPIRTGWSAPSDISTRCPVRPTSFRGRSLSPWISAPRRILTASARSPISCAGSRAIAKRRTLALQVDVTHENRTVPCAPWLKAQVAEAVAAEGFRVFELPSGAGHDGMAMIDIADVAMLFVRCRGGISHHPAEHVEMPTPMPARACCCG